MGEVVKATAKAAKTAKKGIKTQLKIWFACILATILVVGSAGGSFLIVSKVFENKLNQMVNEQYKGETGAQGPQGPQGVSILSIEKTGSNGNYDIYTIAYSNGLSTTFQVKNGEDGTVPFIGPNGHWWVDGADTGVLADVELNLPYIGTNGNWWVDGNDTGKTAQGQDGQTPYIKDGNWWIGNTNMGVSAAGKGILSITPLAKNTSIYNQYITENGLEAAVTDVYQIMYTDFTPSYFHVTNGRGGNGTGSGVNGKDGTQWSSGDLAPVDTLGNPGDFYLYTTTNEVYQKQCTQDINLRYTGKLVEKDISKATFDELKNNAATYGLEIADNSNAINYQSGITMTQINALVAADIGLEQSFYYYAWNYLVDGNTVHLSGYIAAEGALSITTDEYNNKVIAPIHYTWIHVSTLQGADGADGQNGASAYEFWKDYTLAKDPNAEVSEEAFINSLIVGKLEDYAILESGFWGKKTDLTDEDLEDTEKVPADEQYMYEKIDGVWYKNIQVSARGEQGAKGQKGDQGAQGVDGLSAYDLYYNTTEDNPKKSVNEWLASLVGQKGEQGGDGYTPEHSSLTNTWWINGKDTGVTSSVSVYIGENGHWYINNADSGKPARGDQGITGNGIASITMTSSVDGISNTYAINFTNPGLTAGDDGYLLPFEFTVTNGIDGTNGKSAFEIWQDYHYYDEDKGYDVYPNAGDDITEADFLKAMTGNGITSITRVDRDENVDTYKITYTNGDTYNFTVTNGTNGKDGLSAYQVWLQQKHPEIDINNENYYEEFFKSFAIDAVNGLTILESGNWGIWAYENDEAIPDAEKGNYVQGFDGAYYKDTGVQAKGDSGATGKSAYDIYLDTVPSDETPLTKSQWLASLKGETGAAGKDAQLEITENGYWKIGGVVTNMKVTGEKGEKGDTPYISADGFWCVGDKNLGVPARGLKGDQGETGVSISDINKISTSGAVDTYEIAFSDGRAPFQFSITNGTDGTDGKDGSDLTMDFGEPTAAAKDGDIYINLNNGEMYRYNNGWGAVVGTMRGSQWFTGAKNLTDLNKDSSGLNIDGYKVIKNDLYLNTVNRDVYKYDGTAWVQLGNLGGAGAVKTDPVAWLDTTTLPNLPDGAAIGKWGVGGDTNWNGWQCLIDSTQHQSLNVSLNKKNGVLSVTVPNDGRVNTLCLGVMGSRITANTYAMIKFKCSQSGHTIIPEFFAGIGTDGYEVLSGSVITTGDWQTILIKYNTSFTGNYNGIGIRYSSSGTMSIPVGMTFEIESYYVGKLDYSTQLMDLSGNYNNISVSGNYMTNDGLVLNKTVTSNATAWNTTNMTYFVDFADVKQNGNGTALFGVGTPGAASQFSIDINTNRDMFINGSMAGRTLANGKPLTIAVRVDGNGKCQYTVDGVAWQNVNTDAASAVSGAQLYFGGTGSVLRRAMVFDYYLDDAAVYAVFNHQIADLPNPQSPYKKDNPKTWGDGVLIDFGDGTAGFAREVKFDNTKNNYFTSIYNLRSNGYATQTFGDIISWGGVIRLIKGNIYSIPTFAYYNPSNPLFVMVDVNNECNVDIDFGWGKGANLYEDGTVPNINPDTIWVWVIVEYHA